MMRKKLICSLFSLGMIVQYILSPQAVVVIRAQEEGLQEFVQEELTPEATQYMEDEWEDIQQVLVSCEKEFGIVKQEVENLALANPFVIYDVESDTQEKCIYFPLVNRNSKKIVAVVALVKTTIAGWQYTISRDWAERLNELDYLGKEYLFYQVEGNITAEREEAKFILNGKGINDDFDDRSYREKEQEIKEKMRKWEKLDVKECLNQDEKTEYGYSPSTSVMTDGVYCKLKNAKGQGASSLCWAASAITVVNYRKGTDYSAKEAAKKMGLSGEQGITNINKTIRKYDLDYLVMHRKPDFTLIKSSAKRKWPMVIGGRSKSDLGHAVTVYGYRENSGKCYVMIWNPDRSGSTSIATYNASGLVFNSAGIDFVTDATSYCRKVLSYK